MEKDKGIISIELTHSEKKLRSFCDNFGINTNLVLEHKSLGDVKLWIDLKEKIFICYLDKLGDLKFTSEFKSIFLRMENFDIANHYDVGDVLNKILTKGFGFLSEAEKLFIFNRKNL